MAILGSQTVTLRRSGAGTYNSAGEYVPGLSTDSTISGSFQPNTGRTVENLEEGQRQSPKYKFYTTTALFAADPLTGLPSDKIIVDGETYEVEAVGALQQLGSVKHFKAILKRLQEAP